MYTKIALGNVKKSFKDYSIYFLTITLAVCIFYSFNSIESQQSLVEMQSSKKQNVEVLVQVISMLSVFVSVILGSLILYANNFLIKKRKKELGIYMTLGMSKRKISRILVTETLIVGIGSLISGLLLGLVASQGLSLLTANLFEITMTEYTFMISFNGILKTILYFSIMFLLIIIFNVFVISRYKIIDLLFAGRKNEKIKFKNSYIYIVAFILCIISLGSAYTLVIQSGINTIDIRFNTSIVLGIVGTVLFFFSLSGFGLYIFRKNKNIYFKGLNIFVIKQVNSKINTHFISMSVICLMLFLTIGILSTGISFKNALEADIEETTPFDASATIYIHEEDKVKSIEESLKGLGVKFENGEEFAYYNQYVSPGIDKNYLLNKDKISNESKKILDVSGAGVAVFIKESDFNNILKLDNKPTVDLKDNEVLFLSNAGDNIKLVNDYLENYDSIKIENKEYKIKNNKAIDHNLKTDAYRGNTLTIVVKDDVVDDFQLDTSNININFSDKYKNLSEEKFTKLFQDFKDGNVDYEKYGFINGYTKKEIFDENKGMTTTVLFVGVYLGITFLIASMAVLALQQLSEASDSIERYKSLKRIGANEKMINRTIFMQTLIYFTLPVLLAFIHSIVGIRVANDFIATFSPADIGPSALITAVIFMIVYTGYFYSTYTGYKNIIKNM